MLLRVNILTEVIDIDNAYPFQNDRLLFEHQLEYKDKNTYLSQNTPTLPNYSFIRGSKEVHPNVIRPSLFDWSSLLCLIFTFQLAESPLSKIIK